MSTKPEALANQTPTVKMLLDGKFIDYPILYRAQRVLEKVAPIRAKEKQR